MSDVIREMIEQAERILVVTHVGPDGDAIGSLTAVGQMLVQLGKSPDLICDDGVPERFHYLPLADQVRSQPRQTPYDLLIAVDCGDEQRLGNAYAKLEKPPTKIINIDHHVTNTRFGHENLIDPAASSTTEILYTLFRQSGIVIDRPMALSLLTGLVTDTLAFRTAGVTAQTLAVASDLVEAGADLSAITMQALNIKPMKTIRLWKVGLNNMQLVDGLALSSISLQERQEAGYTGAGTSGLVNVLADIEEAVMGVALMEVEEGVIRVGFRCRPPYDVSELATELGGGGHPLAAGCTIYGSLTEATELVRSKALLAIETQSK